MNQKLEDQLQLALETSEEDRERTEDLNIGFDGENRTWELIVKYHGSLEALERMNVTVEYLLAGYALLTVPEGLVEQVAELPEIEYVEKPKRFFYSQVNPVEDSCIVQVTRRDPFLSGSGVLMAILDSGIDYRLPEFRNADGSTRIRYLWDQTLRPTGTRPLAAVDTEQEQAEQSNGQRLPPAGFALGVEFDSTQINRALGESNPQAQYQLLPTVDTSGHGTAVAGIAAGSSDVYQGVAPRADLLIVKLGLPDAFSFPRTTEIMRGLTYAVNKAIEMQMPLVINLSFGNSYGAHDGSSLLERFLDNVAEVGRTAICVGSGNEGANGGHLAGSLTEGQDEPGGQGLGGSLGAGPATGIPGGSGQGTGLGGIGGQGMAAAMTAQVELAVAEYERNLNVQLWKNYSDEYRIRLRSPGGQEVELSARTESGKYTVMLEQTEVLVFFGGPSPYSAAQEIYMEFLPTERPYVNSGIWTFLLQPVRIVTGRYYFYLPSGTVRNAATGFFRSTPEVTLTIPSTAAKIITVGAYNSTYDAYADFSGRGYADPDRTLGVVTAGMAKPDLAAPGVGVLAPDIYGGYTPVTGTSFATPIVSGSAALLMEWGIVRGNDPFLYGEKVKAYLRRGAQSLRGEVFYPNARVGWGKLCLSESLPT